MKALPINVSGDLQWSQLICPRGMKALPINVSGGPTVVPINLSKGDREDCTEAVGHYCLAFEETSEDPGFLLDMVID